MPIPMTPGYVSADVEADLIISAVITFSKVPEIIHLPRDLLFLKQNKSIHTCFITSVISKIHAEEACADSVHCSTAVITTVQLLPKVKKLPVQHDK